MTELHNCKRDNEWDLKVFCHKCGKTASKKDSFEVLHDNNWFFDEDITHINQKFRKIMEEKETEMFR